MNDNVPTVTCRCGRRLKLPGAVAGRVGRCPSCGAMFQVGATSTQEPPPESPPAPPKTQPRRPSHDAPAGGYEVAPEWATGEEATLNPAPRDEAPRPVAMPQRRDKAVGAGGLLALPEVPEKSIFGSLKYPLWDGFGIVFMLLWPLPLTILSLIVLGVLPMALWGDDPQMLLLAPITLGFIVVFAAALGYLAAALGNVLVSSARGELAHPRWPDVDFGTIAVNFMWWLAAIGLGLAASWWLARPLIAAHPKPELVDRLVISEVLALGGCLTITALISIYLHESIQAVDPRLVVPAMFRLGGRLLGPWLLLHVFVALGVLIVAGIYWMSRYGFFAVLSATWLAWVYALYAGMVVMRAAGRAYKRRAKHVGWFKSKRKRVELPVEVTPSVPISEI